MTPHRRISLLAALGLWLTTPAPTAHAESSRALPAGSQVIYNGVGLSTFGTGVSGAPRDRQMRYRIDVYGSVGLRGGLQLSADFPLIYNTHIEIPSEGPCPNPNREGYCDPVAGVGEAGVHLRKQLTWQPINLQAGLGLRSDVWNAETRDQWTNAGQGVTSIVASLIVGDDFQAGSVPMGWNVWGHYCFIFGREVTTTAGTERFPKDMAKAGVEAFARFGDLQITAILGGLSRLGGVEFGDTWLDVYVPTDDLWAVLKYQEIRGEAKLSLSLGDASGLHLTYGRSLYAVNGASGVNDIALGWHHYFAPR